MGQLKLSDIQAALEAMDAEQRWHRYLAVIKSFESFWQETLTEMTRLTSSQKKLETHRQVVAGSFELMDDWHFSRKSVVKARRNEIDSAISFIRNAALEKGARNTLGAACARNLAGILRSAVYLSIHGYEPHDYPAIMTNSLFNLAAVCSVFPADTSDFVQFLNKDENIVAGTKDGKRIKANIDNLQVMIERGCKELGINEASAQLQGELVRLWRSFSETQTPWQVPAGLWELQVESTLAEVYFKGQQRFLNR